MMCNFTALILSVGEESRFTHRSAARKFFFKHKSCVFISSIFQVSPVHLLLPVKLLSMKPDASCRFGIKILPARAATGLLFWCIRARSIDLLTPTETESEQDQNRTRTEQNQWQLGSHRGQHLLNNSEGSSRGFTGQSCRFKEGSTGGETRDKTEINRNNTTRKELRFDLIFSNEGLIPDPDLL